MRDISHSLYIHVGINQAVSPKQTNILSTYMYPHLAWHGIASHRIMHAATRQPSHASLSPALSFPVLCHAYFQEVDQVNLTSNNITEVVSFASQSRVPTNQPPIHTFQLLHIPRLPRPLPRSIPLSPCSHLISLRASHLISCPRPGFPL